MTTREARKIVDEARSGDNPVNKVCDLALYHGSQRVRALALWELGEIKGERCSEVALNSFDPTETIAVQIMAAKVCGRRKIKAAVPKLTERLAKCDDWRINSAILRALMLIGDISAKEAVAEFIKSHKFYPGELNVAAMTLGYLSMVEQGIELPEDLWLAVLWN